VSRQRETIRRARFVCIMALLYALILPVLAWAVHREADVAQRVWLAEAAVAAQAHSAAAADTNIGADVATARERLNELEALWPQTAEPELLRPLVQAAEAARLREVRLEAGAPAPLTGKSNTPLAHGYNLAARGSHAAVRGFLDSLHRDSSPAVLVDSIVLAPFGGEWAITAGIVVFTWGGEE
jgi:hypothetical protein